jgi:hypothetical protein
MYARIFKTSLMVLALSTFAGLDVRGIKAMDNDAGNEGQQANRNDGAKSVDRDLAPSPFKLEPGGRLSVRNLLGGVMIIGRDGDTVEATAKNETSGETFPVNIAPDPARADTVLISVEAENSAARQTPRRAGWPLPLRQAARANEKGVMLTIKLPRYAEVESVSTVSGQVVVKEINGSVTIRSGSGNVEVEDVNGPVNVTLTHGNVSVRNASGDVHLFALVGELSVQCAQGEVEANNTSGAISLLNVGGSVEAETTGGSIELTSPLKDGKHYRLKTMSGKVRMGVAADAPGFTATLSSYRGEVSSDFQLSSDPPSEANHLLTGRYGNGQAQINLNSFGGNISLERIEPGALSSCGR